MSIELDAADLIASFATGKYRVTRRGATAYSADGVAASGGPSSSFEITAAVFPASGRDLLRLPEGRRSVETRMVFATGVMLVGAAGGREADLVAIDGDSWEVQQSEAWPAATGYCKAIVQRVGTRQP